MTAQDWVLIIGAVGTAVTATLSALIPLLIRELRANTRATLASTNATNARVLQSAGQGASVDPTALLAAIAAQIDSALQPKPAE